MNSKFTNIIHVMCKQSMQFTNFDTFKKGIKSSEWTAAVLNYCFTDIISAKSAMTEN